MKKFLSVVLAFVALGFIVNGMQAENPRMIFPIVLIGIVVYFVAGYVRNR